MNAIMETRLTYGAGPVHRHRPSIRTLETRSRRGYPRCVLAAFRKVPWWKLVMHLLIPLPSLLWSNWVKRVCTLLAMLFVAAPTLAHVAPDGRQPAPSYLTGWDPFGLLLVAVLACAYASGMRRLPDQPYGAQLRTRAALLFWAGWGALVAAFALESLSGLSFAAHMIQHEILMLLAAPLLVLSRPHGVLIWGLPKKMARVVVIAAASRSVRRTVAALCAPFAAWLLHAIALWIWHVPPAFEATLTSEPLHWLQHASFFLSAVIFWHSVLMPGPQSGRAGAALLSIFTTAVHTSLLGALLTFSSTSWYPTYQGFSGLTAIEDQQLGGLVMWVPGGAVFLASGMAIAARWLTSAEGR
jgi:putative membrane protein